LDVGCATGDLIYYLQKKTPAANFTGMDVMEELLEKARKENPKIQFLNGDIIQKKTLPDKKFDVIFCNGVLPIFDDIFTALDNILELLKENGRVFIFSIFNDEEFDVLVKVRKSSDHNGPWQSGWNLFSKKSILDYLEKKNFKHEFIDWEMPIDLKKNPQDALRAWTFKDNEEKRLIINGTGILHSFSLLIIKTN
jgi:ubiquinone/menaquinone biosynthesis C-methylase UbiE